ncbi:hypothetical protein K469DRAFT_692452 [Zopfia rhizophila CBS 207.26]|uniref:Amino acid permease/ SLC12A domain-containing protein n=1 Tax=Zopfia rhizophila CBS 207.26 TaxID=1314779 RepID=A0A6A6DTC5_9PEZI|nr:hypothetical protein K469DRAFT_692452 [Zopfia rhizophila CBS 207.26]
MRRRVKEGLSSSTVDKPILRRELMERHINLMALSACIGIGLWLQGGGVFLQSALDTVLHRATACIVVGVIALCVRQGLVEMTACFPSSYSPIGELRSLLEEVGRYGISWTHRCFSMLLIVAEASMIAQIFTPYIWSTPLGFEIPGTAAERDSIMRSSLYMALLFGVILLANFLSIRVYGVIERICRCSKILFLSMLLTLGVIISANPQILDYSDISPESNPKLPPGSPTERRVLINSTLYVSAIWTEIPIFVFSLIGFETSSLAIEERDRHKRKNGTGTGSSIFKNRLRVVLISTLIYVVATLDLPWDNPKHRNLGAPSFRGAPTYRTVMVPTDSKSPILQAFMTVCLTLSACGSPSTYLYISSRHLHSLACSGSNWPRWPIIESIRRQLQLTLSSGVPVAAVLLSWCIGCLELLFSPVIPPGALIRLLTSIAISQLGLTIMYVVMRASRMHRYVCFSFRCLGHDFDSSAFDDDDIQYNL